MRAAPLGVLLIMVIAGDATAQATSQRLELEVGQHAEVDVDYKIGFACDQPKLVRATMITRNKRNVFVVDALAVGSTLCRVGTDPTLPSYLFEVVVRDKRARPGA